MWSVLVCFLLFSAIARAESEEPIEEKSPTITWQVSADFVSRYVWRGYAYTAGPVIQPDAQIGAYGFWLELWGNVDLTDESAMGHTGRFNEIDPSLNYSHTWGPFSVEPSLEFYFYPNQTASPATAELDMKFSYELGPVTLESSHNFDIFRNRGSYFGDFGVSWEHEFHPKLSLESSASLGWASAKFNSTYGAASKTALNLFQWGMAVNCRPVRHLLLRPHLDVSVLIDGDIRSSVIGGQDPEIVSGGMQVGLEF